MKGEIRKPLLFGILLLGCLLVALVVFYSKFRGAPEGVSVPMADAEETVSALPTTPPPEEPVPVVSTDSAPATSAPAPAAMTVATAVAPLPSAPALIRPEASPVTRQMVGTLSQLVTNGPMTAEKVEAFKQTLGQLLQQGGAAVPAVWEYLDQNVNVNFPPETAAALGHSSMRMALLSTLMGMDSPDALGLGIRTLGTTADPREIAFLAASLDARAPGEHREMAIDAARRALQLASGGNLQGMDAGPLFQVLQSYGNANVIGDLQQAGDKWRYYSTIALAGLPDGSGIPVLIDMAKADPASGGRSSRTVALQMLAQVASTSPEARDTILQQAKSGNIPPVTWMNMASALGGDVYQIGNLAGMEPVAGEKRWSLANGQQAFYSRPYAGAWSPDDINGRISIIDQLLGTNPGAAAADALQKARNGLAVRLATPQ